MKSPNVGASITGTSRSATRRPPIRVPGAAPTIGAANAPRAAAPFASAARLAIVAGKGGVGKTTVTAALARMAARAGLSTLVIEVEGKSGLPTLFGADDLDYNEVVMAAGGPGVGEIRARTLTPDDAL